MALLSDLVLRLDAVGLAPRSRGRVDKIEIDRLVFDSRHVGPNGMFVAVRGTDTDGHLFIDKAVHNGAIAIVCEAVSGATLEEYPDIAFVQVTDSRAALGHLASIFYDDPSKDVDVVGVTGTNGKTTTVFLVHHIMKSIQGGAGLLGTIHYDLGQRVVDATHTTPDACSLQSMLSEMRSNGCRACAMEVSSHALAQERVAGVRFAGAVFTNLTQDHLDFHGSMDAYLETKKVLFDTLGTDAFAVFNADESTGNQIVSQSRATRTSYGRTRDADIRFQIESDDIDGLVLQVGDLSGRFRLSGTFNAYNLIAAFATARAMGFDPVEAWECLQAAPPVPGRLERVVLDSNAPIVIVDYAHTPDALENVLDTLRSSINVGALWCVFGCGGDRDRTKRPKMGRIAERLADHVVVTDDNPRTEVSEQIFAEIRTGFSRPDRASWISDRAKAIRFALEEAHSDDVVLIAGKGHETYQVIGTEKIRFDDREVALKSWNTIRST